MANANRGRTLERHPRPRASGTMEFGGGRVQRLLLGQVPLRGGRGDEPRGADRRRARRLLLDGALARARAGRPPLGVGRDDRRRPPHPGRRRLRDQPHRPAHAGEGPRDRPRRVPARRGGDEERLPGLEGAGGGRPRSTSTRSWWTDVRSDAFRAAAEAKDFGGGRRAVRRGRHLPQPGRLQAVRGPGGVKVLLGAVVQVFEDFRYVEQVETGDAAVLMFEARVGDKSSRASTS